MNAPPFTVNDPQPSLIARLWSVLKNVFCTIGILVVALIVLQTIALSKQKAAMVIKPNTTLHLSFDSDFYENRPEDLIGAMTYGNSPTVSDIVLGLNRATKDKNIKGLIAYLPSTNLSLAQVQEIRAAIADFRKAGKKTIVYAPTFGELGGGLSSYYLASAFEDIRIQPTGEVGVAGIALQTPYFRRALEKIGISPSFEARHEYKTGADSLNASEMSVAERENLTALMDSFMTQVATDIGKERNIKSDKMRKILLNGPYFADKAKEMGLIDKVEYADVLEDELRDKKAEILNFFDYTTLSDPIITRKDKVIALIPAVGVIQEGDSAFSGSSYHSILGTSTFSTNIRSAADDNSVKAIILRLDSPGGGYIASDTMWRELEYVKNNKNLPIICSIGSVAASGGYFLSLGCDKVIASPSSLTGSIGVFGGKLVIKNLLDKLDIAVNTLAIGENAGLTSATNDFTPAQRRFFNASLDRIYSDFTAKVANRRGFDTKTTDKLARGRVFTGNQAVQNGLIDGVGGLNEAVQVAMELSGQKRPLPVVEYPIPPTKLEMIVSFLSSDKMQIKGMVPRFKAFIKQDYRAYFTGLEIKK